MFNYEREMYMPDAHITLNSVGHIAYIAYYISGKNPMWFCLQLSNWVSVRGRSIHSFLIALFAAPHIMLMQSFHVSLLFLATAFYQPLYPLAINHLYWAKSMTNRRVFHSTGEFASWKKRIFFLAVLCRSKTLQLEVPIVFH